MDTSIILAPCYQAPRFRSITRMGAPGPGQSGRRVPGLIPYERSGRLGRSFHGDSSVLFRAHLLSPQDSLASARPARRRAGGGCGRAHRRRGPLPGRGRRPPRGGGAGPASRVDPARAGGPALPPAPVPRPWPWTAGTAALAGAHIFPAEIRFAGPGLGRPGRPDLLPRPAGPGHHHRGGLRLGAPGGHRPGLPGGGALRHPGACWAR